QLHEGFDAGAGRGQRLGERFGRGPTRAAVTGDALRLVEGGRIEAGLFGQAGGRQADRGRKAVEGGPHLGVGQHDGCCWPRRRTGILSNSRNYSRCASSPVVAGAGRVHKAERTSLRQSWGTVPTTIYKICENELWREAERTRVFYGGAVD